jgi:hypothetical protein
MVALVAADVTVTVRERRIQPSLKKRRLALTLAFGDGAKTYPAGGVPMPDFKGLGFQRFLDTIDMTDDASANGYLYKYDEANNKLRIYQGDNTNAAAAPNIEVTGAHAPAATSIRAIAWGW